MAILADISLKRGIGILLLVLALLGGGTWAIVRVTIDHHLDSEASEIARDWAKFIGANVLDLEQIAHGEQPSNASVMFLNAASRSGAVFRFTIFNREGYSQLVSDPSRIEFVELSEFNAAAARAGQLGEVVVEVKEGSGVGQPAYYAEAYVPVLAQGRPVAVVGAFVDETAQREQFIFDFAVGAIALFLLTALSFSIPAVAWYLRTKEKQQADQRIHYLAHHDALTGLANRTRLIERLEGALAVLPATGRMIATHFIDVDRFKEVNDTLGHDGGDFLLSTLGKRLNALTRADDLVSRLGGDEFVVVQSGVTSKEQAEAFAKRIAAAVNEPMYFKEQEIVPHITIGVSIAPADGKTPERLLKSADLALYTGKTTGRDRISFFAPEMDEALQTRLKLERLVRNAVAKGGFELHYQPVFAIDEKNLLGFEALVRLPDVDGTLIPPMTFIPVAEEMRLVDKVGEWVLREACRTAATWPEMLTVAVNLSPSQFETGDIVATVAAALEDTGLEPKRLELEITENLLIRNNDAAVTALHALKAMGVSIVMDDFGTGYSSLSYLWKFPFDKIKIDQSFMEGFDKSGRDAKTVVKTIIALGRELNMRVTVEGVETSNQMEFLHHAEADQVQGFYFGKPVPATDIRAGVLENFRESMPSVKRPASKVHAAE